MTNNLKPDLDRLTGAIHVPDSASINMVYRLLAEEGLYVGASSALNVWAAAELAKRKGKGSTVVTILCDGAYRQVPHCVIVGTELTQADTRTDCSRECGSSQRACCSIFPRTSVITSFCRRLHKPTCMSIDPRHLVRRLPCFSIRALTGQIARD